MANVFDTLNTNYTHFKGKFILSATIHAKPGKVDEVATLVCAIRDLSISDREPGTLTYRVSKGENIVYVFEEYANPEALDRHQASSTFEEFKNGGNDIIEKFDISYYEEI